MQQHVLVLFHVIILATCSSGIAAPPLPTANVRAQAAAKVLTLPTLVPATEPALLPVPATPTPATAEEQYRAWMEEARLVHPYAESVEQMWAVMLCESGAQPAISNGINIGLFQYAPATWAGDWNPYRDTPITDARAQIFATAKAWQDGHQSWWGCYGQG